MPTLEYKAEGRELCLRTHILQANGKYYSDMDSTMDAMDALTKSGQSTEFMNKMSRGTDRSWRQSLCDTAGGIGFSIQETDDEFEEEPICRLVINTGRDNPTQAMQDLRLIGFGDLYALGIIKVHPQDSCKFIFTDSSTKHLLNHQKIEFTFGATALEPGSVLSELAVDMATDYEYDYALPPNDALITQPAGAERGALDVNPRIVGTTQSADLSQGEESETDYSDPYVPPVPDRPVPNILKPRKQLKPPPPEPLSNSELNTGLLQTLMAALKRLAMAVRNLFQCCARGNAAEPPQSVAATTGEAQAGDVAPGASLLLGQNSEQRPSAPQQAVSTNSGRIL